MPSLDETREVIAGRLREAREQSGLSQGQAAKLVGMHRPTISEIEAGRRRVAAEELVRLADIYGVSIAWLTGETPATLDASAESVRFAARELERLQPDDLSQVLRFIASIRGRSGQRGAKDE